MARRVDGPEITGQVVHKQTGQSYGGVTVTVSPKVYTDPEMTASVTSLTADGTGVFSCYAPPGVYTFTTTAVDAQTLEPVEVLGREGGTGVSSTASLPSQTGNNGKLLSTDGSNPLWVNGVQLAQSGQTPAQEPVAPGTVNVGSSAVAMRADAVLPSMGLYAWLGDGPDGDFTLDGTTNPNSTFFSRSGTVYTLNLPLFAHNLTINSGVTLNTAQQPLYVSGTLTNTGTIAAVGGNASGATAGQAGNASASPYFNIGGNGAAGGTGAGAQGQQTRNAGGGNPAFYQMYGGSGGAGGAGSGGAGGAAQTQTGVNALTGFGVGRMIKSFLVAATGILPPQSNNSGSALYGGAGGSAGGGDGTNAGGGGGAGGGAMLINAYKIVNNGAISTNGGNGANGVAGNAGGGGGGGGGPLVINTLTAVTGSGTITANGGTHGNGVGTGSAGSDGAVGYVQTTVWA